MDIIGYQCEVRFSAEDECYVVTFPAIPGCSAHGEQYREAIEEARVALQLWLETAVQLGREIPTPGWFCEE